MAQRAKTRASTEMAAALETFERLGAPWAVHAPASSGPAGWPGRAGTGGALSPREYEIAALAASRLTNKQIGEKLFVSPRTVGDHLHESSQARHQHPRRPPRRIVRTTESRGIEIDSHGQKVRGYSCGRTNAEPPGDIALAQDPFALAGVIVIEDVRSLPVRATAAVRPLTRTRGLASMLQTRSASRPRWERSPKVLPSWPSQTGVSRSCPVRRPFVSRRASPGSGTPNGNAILTSGLSTDFWTGWKMHVLNRQPEGCWETCHLIVVALFTCDHPHGPVKRGKLGTAQPKITTHVCRDRTDPAVLPSPD